jgi:Zn-dependent protease/predicted transcriptional regulator
MFGRGITLIKLFGFEVKIDLSWLILGFLITWTLATGVFPTYDKGLSRTTYWVMGVVGALGLLVSIVFHELWHSLVARRFGLPMKGITLFVFGGVAEMSDEPPSPKAEFFMAVAGPLSSVFMGLALVGISFLGRHGAWPRPVVGVVSYLGFLNLILAGFNLVPAFPLDGGRVLRSILWGWKNNVRWATHVASQIGSGFGIVLILVGVIEFLFGNLIGGIWMFLIGLFLRGASRSAYQQIVIRRALEGENVRKFMKENPVTVSSKVSLQEFVDDYIFRYHFKMFPVVDEGKLVGCVTLSQVKEVPREKWGSHLIGELAKGCSSANTISPDADAMKALSLMSRNNASRLMVVQGDKLVGVIALKDMMRLLSLKVDLEK